MLNIKDSKSVEIGILFFRESRIAGIIPFLINVGVTAGLSLQIEPINVKSIFFSI